jgi:hypothetical protein
VLIEHKAAMLFSEDLQEVSLLSFALILYQQIKFSWLRRRRVAWKEQSHSEERHWKHVQSTVVILAPLWLKENRIFRQNFRKISPKVF